MIGTADGEADMDAFNGSGHLRSTALPLSTIGAKHSGVAAKYEAVFSSLKLDVARPDVDKLAIRACVTHEY